MYLAHTWTNAYASELKLTAAPTTNNTNDWRIRVDLTGQTYMYLSKEEAYQLASSLELALLELKDDEVEA